MLSDLNPLLTPNRVTQNNLTLHFDDLVKVQDDQDNESLKQIPEE